jgi:hypothetical protein
MAKSISEQPSQLKSKQQHHQTPSTPQVRHRPKGLLRIYCQSLAGVLCKHNMGQ